MWPQAPEPCVLPVQSEIARKNGLQIALEVFLSYIRYPAHLSIFKGLFGIAGLCYAQPHLIPLIGATMATARIIQFGQDSCHRLTVMKEAGYSVEGCRSVTELRAALRSQDAPDAVVITDENGSVPVEAIREVKSAARGPVILFANADEEYPESSFDLVIPVLTPPANWLARIQEAIEHSRSLQVESWRLRHEAAAVSERSRSERARSRAEYARNRELLK